MAQAHPQTVLPPLSPSTFYLRKVTAPANACIHLDFSSADSFCRTSSSVLTPTFNCDGRHFTPSFILTGDQRYSEHWEVYLGIHLRKTTEMQQQKSNLLVPRPSRNNSYCCVCKIPFEDYLTHVSTPSHLILMHKSEYHHRIEELCATFPPHIHSLPQPQAVKKRGRPAKTMKQVKTKPIGKLPTLTSKRSLSGKETSDQSNKVEDEVIQIMA